MRGWSGLLALMFALISVGCGLKNAADEMRDSTKRIEGGSDHLVKRTDDLEGELTFKESGLMMEMNMRYMWGEDSPRGQKPSDIDTIFYAGYVMKSMWFQFWKGDYNDNLAALDERFATGAEILLTRVKSHSPSTYVVDTRFGINLSYKGVGALGAKLDFTRPEYLRAITQSGYPNFTFYDLLVMALRQRHVTQYVGPFPKAVAKVLEFEQEAVYLLQLRHNFLPMMVVSSISDFRDRWFNGLTFLLTKQPVDISGYNIAQFQEWTVWLKNARQTREDLKAMGIAPIVNGAFRMAQNNVEFEQNAILSAKALPQTPIEKARREFAATYVDLLK